MTDARHAAIGAVLAMVAGALLVVVPLLVEFVDGDFFALMGIMALTLLASLPGLRRAQAGRDGASGRRGLRMLVGGLVVVAVLIASADALDAAVSGATQDVVETVFMLLAALAALAAMAGTILFGHGLLRAQVLPARWVWTFLAGMVLALVSESFEQSLAGTVPRLADVLPPLGFIVAGVGLLGIGSATWRVARGDGAHHAVTSLS